MAVHVGDTDMTVRYGWCPGSEPRRTGWAFRASRLGFLALLGGPLAGTQPFEKFFSKSDLGGPHGVLPPGNPSIEVGGFAPHLNSWVSPREEAVWIPQIGF